MKNNIISYGPQNFQQTRPESLYKFKAFTDHSVCYFDGEIVLSHPRSLNDPWDCQIIPLWGNLRSAHDVQKFYHISGRPLPDYQHSVEIWNNILADPIAEDQKFLTYIDELMRVFSLSSSWEVELLWSHYADSSKGFCVEYSFEAMVNFLSTLTQKDNIKLAEVTYNQVAVPPDPLKKNIAESMGYILRTKSDPWAYEEEWRVICSGVNQPQFSALKLPHGVITKIIFGHRAEQTKIALASQRIKLFDPNVKMFKLQPLKNCYKYDLIPLP